MVSPTSSHAASPMSTSGRLHAPHLPPVVLATAQGSEQTETLAKARAFAEPLIAGETLDTGENILAHADAVAEILAGIGGSVAMQAASYLVYACPHLNKPEEVMAKAFGPELAQLAIQTNQLVHVQRLSRAAESGTHGPDNTPLSPRIQTENVRKMLLAFSRDLRVVMLRLASRLQTLRHYAATKLPVPPVLASESLQVFAPLANRLGIWQIKWEMEDLSFRFLEPATYKDIARLLDEKRTERERYMVDLRGRLQQALSEQGIAASVDGRPKHIYSIVRKMRGKSLPFERVFDIRALRVVVPGVADRYQALSWVHEHFVPIAEEFDDYIAKPKANGYQSLHTVVRDADGGPIEVQIRTQAMHDHAENGVAAHWAYKEAGTKGYAGVSATSEYDTKIAVLRQLLAWERDLSGAAQASAPGSGLFDDRIYVLTPDAAVVELPQGATHRLCLHGAHQLGPPLPGRQGRWGHGAAEHPAGQRPDGGDHRQQRRWAVARLAQPRVGLFGQPPCAGQSTRLVQRTSDGRNRRPWARGGREIPAALGAHRDPLGRAGQPAGLQIGRWPV